MGFFDDVKDTVDDAVDEAQKAAKDVAEEAGIEDEVDAVEDTIQRETGVDLGGSGGGKDAADVKRQGDEDRGNRGDTKSVLSGTVTDRDTGGGNSDSGGSGGTDFSPEPSGGGGRTRDTTPQDSTTGGTPRPSRPQNAQNIPDNTADNRRNNTVGNRERVNRTEKPGQDILDLRERARDNPGLAQTAIALKEARNTPTNQQQRQQDPVPFDIGARLSPGRSDRIADIRESVNSRQSQDPISSFLFGDNSQEESIEFSDVQSFADQAEEAGLTTGELRTLTGEEAGDRIRTEVSEALKPQENPAIGFIGKGLAGSTGIASEVIDTADKENILTDSTNEQGEIQPVQFGQEAIDVATSEELDLGPGSEARTVTPQEQRDFENIVANIPGEIAAIPAELQRRIGQGQQLASGELTGAEAVAATETSLEKTREFIEENPRRAAAGGATGFLVTGPLGTRGFRKTGGETVDTGKTKVTEVAEEAKRQAQPGDFDETTVRDFVEGDLGERPQTPEEVQASFDEGDILMGRNVPDVQGSRPTRPRNRREFLKEFGLPKGQKPEELAGVEFSPGSRRQRLKDILTNKRKGQLGRTGKGVQTRQKLVEKTKDKTDNILEDDLTGKDVSISERIDRIADRVRTPDNDRNRFELGRDRDRGFDRPRDRSRGRSDSDTGVGLSSGLGIGLDEDVGEVPGLDQGQPQRQDNPPEEKQPPFQEERTPQRTDNDFDLDTELFRRPERRRDRDDSRRRRRRDRDVDFDIDLGDEENGDNGFDLFGREQERELRRSVGADLLGLSNPDLTETEATNPLSLRGLDQS